MNRGGEGGLNREEGELINLLPLKGGLLDGGGLFEREELNRGFTVHIQPSQVILEALD